jgi:hypothetical protein
MITYNTKYWKVLSSSQGLKTICFGIGYSPLSYQKYGYMIVPSQQSMGYKWLSS